MKYKTMHCEKCKYQMRFRFVGIDIHDQVWWQCGICGEHVRKPTLWLILKRLFFMS